MFHLQPQPQPAQRVPYSDWLSRARRFAEHEPHSPLIDADWQSAAWDAMYHYGLSPIEAVLTYLED